MSWKTTFNVLPLCMCLSHNWRTCFKGDLILEPLPSVYCRPLYQLYLSINSWSCSLTVRGQFRSLATKLLGIRFRPRFWTVEIFVCYTERFENKQSDVNIKQVRASVKLLPESDHIKMLIWTQTTNLHDWQKTECLRKNLVVQLPQKFITSGLCFAQLCHNWHHKDMQCF